MISLWVSLLMTSIICILGSLMSSNFVIKCNCSIWIFLMSCFVAFYYRSYGTFFYNKIDSIIFIGDLPTTYIIEPLILSSCLSQLKQLFRLLIPINFSRLSLNIFVLSSIKSYFNSLSEFAFEMKSRKGVMKFSSNVWP